MVYSNKQLKMNGEKMRFLTIDSKHDDTRPGKLKIKVDKDTTLTRDKKQKILGFHQNKRNTMDSQITATASKVGLAISKLRPALPYLTPKVRKQLVNTKIK